MFAGWVDLQGRTPGPSATSLAAHVRDSNPWGEPTIAVDVSARDNVPAAFTAVGTHRGSTSAGGVHVWSWSALSQRATLSGRLGLPKDSSDGRLLLAAYRAWGPVMTDRIDGAFSFVVWDGIRRRIVAGRDGFGLRTLFYSLTGEQFAFAHSAAPFADQACFAARPDQEWIARNLCGAPTAPAATALRGVAQLEAGHVLINDSGAVTIRRWSRLGHGGAPSLAGRAPGAAGRVRRAIVASVADAAASPGPVGVEVDIDLPQAVLLHAAVETQASESALIGIGRANYDNQRNLILAEAARARLGRASIVTGWPGLGLTWRHWYRTGARALGQPPAHHTHLLATVCLEAAADAGVGTYLDSADRTALGAAFAPLLSRRALAHARLDLALRAQPPGARGRLAGLRSDLAARSGRGTAWQEGPLLRPDIAAEIRRIDAQNPASGQSLRTGTGYSAFTAKGLNAEDRDRLTAMALLGSYHGIDVRFPLLDLRAVSAVLDAPLLSHSLEGIPGRLHQRAFATELTPAVDWNLRRNRGTDRSKENQLAARSAALRRTYLAENLQPLLRDVIDPAAVERLVDLSRPYRAGTERTPARTAAARELAQLEGVNLWLQTWHIGR